MIIFANFFSLLHEKWIEIPLAQKTDGERCAARQVELHFSFYYFELKNSSNSNFIN